MKQHSSISRFEENPFQSSPWSVSRVQNSIYQFEFKCQERLVRHDSVGTLKNTTPHYNSFTSLCTWEKRRNKTTGSISTTPSHLKKVCPCVHQHDSEDLGLMHEHRQVLYSVVSLQKRWSIGLSLQFASFPLFYFYSVIHIFYSLFLKSEPPVLY